MIVYLLIILGNFNAVTSEFAYKSDCEAERKSYQTPKYFQCVKMYRPVKIEGIEIDYLISDIDGEGDEENE